MGPSIAAISRPIAPLSSRRRSPAPCSLEQLVGLGDVDLAAEEVGEDAAVVPGRVVLEPPLEVLEEQLRDAARLDLLVDGAALVGDHLAGQQRRLALDREGAAGLVDVGGLAHQAGRLVDLGLAAAGHDHDLDPGPVAGLQPARLGQSRSPPRRRGTASCPCRAGSRRGRCRRSAVAWCGRYRSGVPWKLADRTLDLEQPLAAGIVNVTVDSMFEGARSGTPEQAVQRRAGAGRGGLRDARRRRGGGEGGPPVGVEEEAAALVPAIEGLAGTGVPISADTFSVEVARRALEAGAVAVNDISGGSDEMFELVAESGCGYVLMHIEGPPRVDRAAARLRRRRRPPAGPGSRGESSAPSPWGSPRSRSRSTPASTST